MVWFTHEVHVTLVSIDSDHTDLALLLDGVLSSIFQQLSNVACIFKLLFGCLINFQNQAFSIKSTMFKQLSNFTHDLALTGVTPLLDNFSNDWLSSSPMIASLLATDSIASVVCLLTDSTAEEAGSVWREMQLCPSVIASYSRLYLLRKVSIKMITYWNVTVKVDTKLFLIPSKPLRHV